MAMKEVGTLKELGVKPGDVVEVVSSDLPKTLPKGYIVKVNEFGLLSSHCGLWFGRNAMGGDMDVTFRIVSRAPDKPKLWRDMTPEEKGALLLAAHEGKVIEYYSHYVPKWNVISGKPIWSNDYAYRIIPEPKIETVAIEPWEIATDVASGHRITFNTINGKPDCASIKMEAL